ncbi:MAG: hypothetical protein ABSC23_06470 [Bryobacteraceae bacterium]|jgi:hypothetical protein
MVTHLAFSLNRKAIVDGILIPKYYDPELDIAVRLASKGFNLPELGEVLLPGASGSQLGTWIPREHYGTGDVPYVRTSDLTHWRIRPDYKKGVSTTLYEELKGRQDVRPLDLLMVAHGSYLVGTSAIVDEEDAKLLLQDHVFRLRVNPTSGVDPYLLLAALTTKFVKRQVRARQFSADIIDKIGERHLGIRVPLPQSEEQRVKVSCAVKAIIDQQTQIRAQIKKVSKSNLRMTRERAEARHGFTVVRQDVRGRVLIPKYYDPALEAQLREAQADSGVPWVTLGQLVKDGVVSLGTGVEVGKMAYGTGTVPFIRTSDIADWEVKREPKQGVSQQVFAKFEKKAALKPLDVLVVRDGTYLVGSSALVTDADVPALFCGGMFRLRVKEKDRLDPHVLLAYLNLPIARKQMRARQFTRDVIDTLGNRILEVTIPSPFHKSAAAIGERVRSIVAEKSEIKAAITSVVRLLEPEVPPISLGRPGWSMR